MSRANAVLQLINAELTAAGCLADAAPVIDTLTVTVRFKPSGRPYKIAVQTYHDRELPVMQLEGA